MKAGFGKFRFSIITKNLDFIASSFFYK